MQPTVVLLAAGKSSRMYPLSDKMLFKYLGKSVLEHQFTNLLDAGFSNFVIVGNKENIDKLKNVLKQIKSKAKIEYAIQKDLSEGIKGGVLASRKFVPLDKPMLLVSSNDFVEKDIFKKVVKQAEKSKSDIFIVGKIVEKYFPGGYLKLNKKNHITHIVEKPKQGKEPSSLINLVIQLYKNPKDLFDTYKKYSNNNDDAHELALQELFDSGKMAEVVEYKGFWQALKYPWHHLKLMNHFLGSLKKPFVHPKAKVSKNAAINGPVYISEGVKIFDFAVLAGPVFVGKNSVIGNHVLVRGSHVGENCVIGHSTEVSRSYLNDHVWTHQNFIGDSIFDENTSLGAGTRTGNLRLDEDEICVNIKDQKINSNINKLGSIVGKDVRIGINVSIMPGIKIGSGSFIGAGMIVDKDVNEKVFRKCNFDSMEKENIKTAPKRCGLI